MKTPETCPNCGAEVPARAKACPECGACEETGWSEEAEGGGLGLPDESFDYDQFVKKEFGAGARDPMRPKPVWALVALVMAVILSGFAFLAWR